MPGIARGSIDTTPRARRGGRHRGDQPRPRGLRRLVLFAAAIAARVIGAGMLLVLPARGALVEGRDGLQTARTALNGGDVSAAREAFVGAEEAFDRAAGQLGNPLTELAGFVPI